MSKTCINMDCEDWISTIRIDNPPSNYLDKNVLAQLSKSVTTAFSEAFNPDTRQWERR